MSERDTLLNWLDHAAARVRRGHRLRDAAALACALFALVAVHQILRATLPAPAVRAALAPFLVFAAAGAFAVFALRLRRRPTVEEAAAHADGRARLCDELRSAAFFAQRSGDGALADLLVGRAARTVRALDVRRMFPVSLPLRVSAAGALALLAAATAWFLPDVDVGASAPATAFSAPRSAAHGAPQPRDAAFFPGREAAADESERAQAVWSQIQELASALTADADSDIARAVAARDARSATRLLQAKAEQRAAQTAGGAAARPESEQMSATLAEGILARLQALLESEAAQPEPAAGSADAPTVQLTEQLRADAEPEAGNARDQQSAGETMLNEMLRAINRSSIGRREIAGGAGEAADEGSRTNAGGGGAMGRRVGVSRAGAQDGERPDGNPAGDAESEPVLGAKTLRLETQLQRVKIESGTDAGEQPASEEALYAQTRAQAARVGYAAVEVTRRESSREAALGSEATPVVFRDAVKRYTLEQHGKEPSGAEGADRAGP